MLDTRLSVRDAAEFHNVSEKTIRRWIPQGILPAERVGPKLIRIDQTEMHLLSKPVATDFVRKGTTYRQPVEPKKAAVGRLLEPWKPSSKKTPKINRATPALTEVAPKENSRRLNRKFLRHECKPTI